MDIAGADACPPPPPPPPPRANAGPLATTIPDSITAATALTRVGPALAISCFTLPIPCVPIDLFFSLEHQRPAVCDNVFQIVSECVWKRVLC
jgi:hypothetical protein